MQFIIAEGLADAHFSGLVLIAHLPKFPPSWAFCLFSELLQHSVITTWPFPHRVVLP